MRSRSLHRKLETGMWFGIVVAQFAWAVELPKNLPPHPRLLFNQSDLPAIKERANGSCKTAFQSLRRQADDWLGREVKLPDRGGQWFHWYSCPRHGARLRTESPTRHVCPVDGEVFTGYPYDDVVISTEHNRFAAAIRLLGIVYQITGDARYAGKAREILLAYTEKYQSYPLHDIHGQPKVGGGKVGPQTLDESTWLITVVEGADCIWDTLNADEQEKVKQGLLLPATDIIRQHKMGVHNIQCWKNSAVGLTGLLVGDMALLDEAVNGPTGYEKQMSKGVTADGPWFEGAWGYHFYTLNAVLHLTEGAYHSGLNLYGPELKRMLDAPLAMAMPNLTLPAFNDSHTVDLAGSAAAYEIAFPHYHDRRYLLVTSHEHERTEADLLHGIPQPGAVPDFEPVSRNFTASGNAILAAGSGTNATWLCMKYGPHGGGHGHPDKLNFVLYGAGGVIAPDPGTANYGVPIQSGWYRTTLAHNTLTVDGNSQRAAEGKCEAFIATNGFSAVMADAGKIYPGLKFYRTIALIEPKLVVFIDQVQAEDTHQYDLAYHNLGQLDKSEGAPFDPPDKPGYSYLRDTREKVSSSFVQLKFNNPDGPPVWWGMAGGQETAIITGTGVGRHTEDRVPLVIARRHGQSTTFMWYVYLGQDGAQVKVRSEEVHLAEGRLAAPANTAALRVTGISGTCVLLANPEGQTVILGDQQLQARVALLSQRPDGKLEVKYTAP